MKHRISILFHLNSSKASKKGLYPIYLRITINGARIELSTSKFVEKSKWNASAGKIKGTNEEARLINSHLEILKSKIYETENWMINLFPSSNACVIYKLKFWYSLDVALLWTLIRFKLPLMTFLFVSTGFCRCHPAAWLVR